MARDSTWSNGFSFKFEPVLDLRNEPKQVASAFRAFEAADAAAVPSVVFFVALP